MTDSMEMEIQRALGRVESKVDLLLVQQSKDSKDLEATKARVAVLERWTAGVAGGGFVLGLLSSLVYKVLYLTK